MHHIVLGLETIHIPFEYSRYLACVDSFLPSLQCQLIGKAAAMTVTMTAVQSTGGGFFCGGKKVRKV